jgi:hypothetical protein
LQMAELETLVAISRVWGPGAGGRAAAAAEEKEEGVRRGGDDRQKMPCTTRSLEPPPARDSVRPNLKATHQTNALYQIRKPVPMASLSMHLQNTKS